MRSKALQRSHDTPYDPDMAIRRFSLGPSKGLHYAEASDVPNLMVIAGPNGAGKSTLLDLIRANRYMLQEPGTTTLFVGPHRTWRSSAINRVSAYGVPLNSYRDVLANDILPSFQYIVPNGLQAVQNQPRQSSSADDAQAFVKTTLIRLRDRQQGLVTNAWNAQGRQITPGSVADLFAPFAELVSTILPHLEWVGVDDSQTENIRALFKSTTTAGPEFDIDDLSSGEKAALALLLPFVEQQAEVLATSAPDPDVVPITMLMDEIEIHLHPTLQLQVLEYIRRLARRRVAQFIVTTHSNTILDELNNDELWLLSAPGPESTNQLRPLATDDERLEVARSLTGSTHALTRSKPIVFVEGESDKRGGASDTRLIRLMIPAARTWALIAGGSKRSVTNSVLTMRAQSLELPGNPVFGIVDSDRDGPATSDPHVVAWPVTMIENLLLDPESIYQALRPFHERLPVRDSREIETLLYSIASGRIEEEVALRIRTRMPIGRLEIEPQELARADEVGTRQYNTWLSRISAIDAGDVRAEASREVEGIVERSQQLQRFHGKRMFRELHSRLNLHNTLSIGAFTLLVADQCADSPNTQQLVNSAVARITLYFPADLASQLAVVGLNTLAARCEREYARWQSNDPQGDERANLRQDVFDALTRIPDTSRAVVASLAAEIGTPT